MTRSWWAKCLFLVVTTLFSMAYVYPTLSNRDFSQSRFPFKQKINLGLDLQGGLYLVLGVDFNKVYRDVTDRQATSFRERAKEKSIPLKEVKLLKESGPVDDPRVEVTFDAAQREAVYSFLIRS